MYLSAVHRALALGLLASVLVSRRALAEDLPTQGAGSFGSTVDTAAPDAMNMAPSQSKGAIALGHEGLKLMDRGEYERAFSLFERAEQLAHSPVFLIYQARAAWQLGHYQTALTLYQACSAEKLDEKSPELWKQTVAEAERERARLSEQMPVVKLSFAGGLTPPLEVTVQRKSEQSGAAVQTSMSEFSSAASQVMDLDPGHYLITVKDRQRRVIEHALRVKPGSHIQLHFEFSALAFREAKRLSVRPNQPGPSALRVGAYAAWSSGSALLIGGAVAGGMAMAIAQDVLVACSGNVCPAEEQARVERAQRLSRLAAAGLVSGLVGEVAGTVLWLWDRHARQLRLTTSGTALAIEGNF